MRALIVEDDPVVGLDLSKALSGAVFVVDLARDGEDASFRGEVEDYAVASLDLGLPRLDGLSVLRRWRANDRTFPVLILSARGDWTEKVEGIEAGADDYLAKPFEMGELLARARSLVRRAAGRMSPVIEARNDSLSPILSVVKPSKSRSTMKPRILSSSLAQTTARSLIGELVIQYLAPFSR